MPNDMLSALLANRMQNLYNGPDEDVQLQQLLQSMPQRPQPTGLQRVLASISGLAASRPQGISGGQPIGFDFNPLEANKISDNQLYGDYNKQLGDWEDKFKATKDVAGLDIKGKNLDRQVMGNLLKNQTDSENIKIRQQRANVYEYKAMHPNHVIKTDANGNLIGINPADNSAEAITDPDGNTIKSATLPDKDKMALGLQNDLAKIGARGSEERKNIQSRANAQADVVIPAQEGAREKLEGIRQPNRLQLKQTPSPSKSTTDKPQSPAAERTARANRANALVMQHPEWSKYIQVQGNDVRIKTPSSGGMFSSGPTQDEFNQITKIILGDTSTGNQSTAKKPDPLGIRK